MEQVADPHRERIKALAVALMNGGSDWKAGIGSLLRAIEEREPGFIAQIAAVNTLERLGLPLSDARR